MTEEEFLKRCYKPYMFMEIGNPRTEEVIEMMLISVDFDKRMFELAPVLDIYEGNSIFYPFTVVNFIDKKVKKLNPDL
jgi:hypothetical protein